MSSVGRISQGMVMNTRDIAEAPRITIDEPQVGSHWSCVVQCPHCTPKPWLQRHCFNLTMKRCWRLMGLEALCLAIFRHRPITQGMEASDLLYTCMMLDMPDQLSPDFSG